MTDFYEDDEDPTELAAAFDAGDKITSAPPGSVRIRPWTGSITDCRATT